jgi:Tfp pilus assembly protein PilF/TolB-like protein
LGSVFWPAAAVITVLIVISVVFWWEIGGYRTTSPKETLMRVAVLPLENGSGDEPGDEFVDGLSETIASTAAGLEPFHHSMWVLPYSETAAADFRAPGVARNAFGVNRLLSGEISLREPGYRLTLNVLDAETMTPVESRHIDFRSESAQSLHTDIYDAVADLLDAEVPPEARPEVQPEGFAAVYQSYLEGVGAISYPDEPADVDNAIGSLKQAIDDHPSFAAAYAWLAEAYLQKSRETNDGGWLTLAESSCKKALQLDGRLVRAQLTMAEVYSATDRSTLALQSYAEALASNPHFTPAHLRLGALLENQNRHVDAEASYRKLIEVEPDYYQGHRVLGRFCHERGRLDEAVTEYQTALRLAPDDWWTLNRLGAALLALDRWDEAEVNIARSFSVGDRTALVDIQTDPLLEDLRYDPRFAAMVQRRNW